MTKLNPSVKQVDPASLRGLASNAETHWLTFATALRCYAQCPTQPELRRAAHRHAPSWLRSALRPRATPRPHEPLIQPPPRPPELDPATGSLAFLTRGAEDALRVSSQQSADQVRSTTSTSASRSSTPTDQWPAPAHWATPAQTHKDENRDRLERYLALAAARTDVTRRHG